MASQYKSINGIKYERDLLSFAEAANGKTMTRADAESLWEKAMDGGKVTPTERRTLEYIMENFKVNDAAKTYLKAKLDGKPAESRLQRKGSSYYKTINGISYDRQLLEEAESRAAAQGGFLRFEDALHLWGKANDGNGITPTEKRSLQYVGQKHRLETEARQFLEKSLDIKITASIQDGPSLPALQNGIGFLKSLWQTVTGKRKQEEGDLPALLDEARSISSSSGAAGPAQDAVPAPQAKRQRTNDSAAADTRPAGALQDASFRKEPSHRVASESPEASLCPELRKLLSEMTGGNDGTLLQLEFPGAPEEPSAPEEPEDAELQAQKAKAQCEVERILKARDAAEILGAGSKEDQRKEFKRLALLIHPDKGFVDQDDARANLAMRLAMAAVGKSRQGA
jgi:hypothetical protein